MFKYMKKYWWSAVLAPIFMFGEVFCDLLQPELMRDIVDNGVLGVSNGGVGDVGLVISIGLRMILILLVGGLCGVMSGVFGSICSQNYGNDVRKDAFKNIMSFSFQQTDEFSTGSLITRVTNDITQLQNFVMQCLRGFIRTFLMIAGGIYWVLTLDLSFGVILACALPLILISVIFFIKKGNPMFTVLQKKLDRVNEVMQENVDGARVVKAYVHEGHEKERFGGANGDLVNTQLRVLILFSYMTPLMNIILNVSVIAVIKIGGIRVAAGAITPGVVMAAITYFTQIMNALMRMTMIFQTFSRGVASGKRIKEVLDCAPVIDDGDFDGDTSGDGCVEFEHVTFAYPGAGGDEILSDISFKVGSGETVAIMGSTGSGKSSLVNLIPRFYDVNGGKVLLDGVDVRDYKLSSLRDKVSIALQTSELFSTTIGENISWGKPEATKEEVLSAATDAQAMEFVLGLADGMDTPVAERGNSLSGGQKQRVAISRAILKNSEVLILDDSTSALDLNTEAKLYAALDRREKKQTRIIIAQRIASVKDADRIIILENGKIAAEGSHEELMRTSEIYQDICSSQITNGGEL